MNIRHTFRLKSIRVGLGIFLTLTVSVFLLASARVNAADPGEHLVTIYDGGTEQTVITTAGTVKEALARAEVRVDPLDAVEPSLNTELVSSVYNINIYRARPVTIIDGSLRRSVISPYQSAKKIAESAQISVYDEDDLQVRLIDDFVGEDGFGLKLTIDRATPFAFDLYGKTTEARTQALTVGEMLKEKNVTLGAQDGTSVPLDTPISAGMSVRVWRNGVQTVTQEQSVAFPIRQIKDADREVGYKQIQTPGVAGKKLVTYEVNLQNGKEISRKEIQVVVTAEPKEQVETVGTKLTNTFNGDFGGALARLRSCESGGTYSRNSGNGYYGAYQYDIQTWGGYKGYANASLAPPNVQDEKAWETYKRRGWQPWPSCKVKMGLQDIYR